MSTTEFTKESKRGIVILKQDKFFAGTRAAFKVYHIFIWGVKVLKFQVGYTRNLSIGEQLSSLGSQPLSYQPKRYTGLASVHSSNADQQSCRVLCVRAGF